MKAMILTAGKGTRLHPITMSTPKPLIPVAGRRILDLIIEKLTREGISQIAINTAHLGNKVSEIIGSGAQYGAEILYSYEGLADNGELLPQALGSAGGLRNVQERWNFFDNTFLVVCGDAYFDIDIWTAVRDHHKKSAVATVIVKQVDDDRLGRYGVVNYDPDGRVRSFQEKPDPRDALSNMINTGIYIFSTQIFEYIPEGRAYDIGSELLPEIVRQGVNFIAHETSAPWLDIGTIEDLHSATAAILAGETDIGLPGKRFGRGMRISESANANPENIIQRGNILIESGCVIEANVRIEGPSVIGRNCVLRRDSSLSRCLVMGEYIEIPAGSCLEDKVITNEHVIDLDGSYVSLQEAGLLDAREISSKEKSKIEIMAGTR